MKGTLKDGGKQLVKENERVGKANQSVGNGLILVPSTCTYYCVYVFIYIYI